MKDQSTSPTQTPTPELKAEEPPKPEGAPEAYKFSVPDGKQLDAALVEKATPIFKELNLPQSAAQKLVDFFNDHATTQADLAVKAVNEMRAGWRETISKDPEMGGKLEQMKADIGKMKDQLFSGDSKAKDAFNSAMDLTGAGDNPAIVSAWWKLAKMFNEGTHVTGKGPSPHGQTDSGNANQRPSLAAAMYPTLPH